MTKVDDKYVISASDVTKVAGIGTLFWAETKCGKRMEFYIEHIDPREQASGQKAIVYLASACELHFGINDSSELIGKEVHALAWKEVIRRASGIRPPRRSKRQSVVTETSFRERTGRFVYVISASDNVQPLCKIGIANSPEKRLKQLSTSSPHALRIELTRYSDNASAVQRAAHSHFSDYRQNGEWFAIPPDQAIAYIVEATRIAA